MDISELTEYIIKKVEEATSLPNYIQGIGLALLGVLVPLAIAILTEVYQKTRGPEEDFSRLDVLVILDKVFKIKNIIIYALLIFIPLIFWEFLPGLGRMLITAVSAIGIAFMVKTIGHVYSWTKGNVFTYRFSLLKNLKNHHDLEIAWDSVWKTEKINPRYELNFFEIFSHTIESKIEEERPDTIFNLIYSFSDSLAHRSLYLLANKDALEKLLKWHHIAWKKAYSKKRERMGDANYFWMMIENVLEDTLIRVKQRILKQDINLFYVFIECLKNHIHRITQSFDISESQGYITRLLHHHYKTFLERVDVPEDADIWRFFPNEWKITKRNIQDKNNIIAKITFAYFRHWTVKRLLQPREDFDILLEGASKNLFPEVDPLLWAPILIFALSPPTGDSKVKSSIERKWTFGHFGRLHIYSSDSESVAKKEKLNTYELATLLFPNLFTKENLTIFIEEAKALKYPAESLEEWRKNLLIEIFQGILDYLEQTS